MYPQKWVEVQRTNNDCLFKINIMALWILSKIPRAVCSFRCSSAKIMIRKSGFAFYRFIELMKSFLVFF